MPSFGNRSKERLLTCHQDLQKIMLDAIGVMDFTILCGHRGEEEQNEAFTNGKSNAQWPFSKHNKLPSHAVDIAPWPIDWEDTERFARLAGIIEGIAFKHDIEIKWGGDFKSIKDMPHIELVRP